MAVMCMLRSAASQLWTIYELFDTEPAPCAVDAIEMQLDPGFLTGNRISEASAVPRTNFQPSQRQHNSAR